MLSEKSVKAHEMFLSGMKLVDIAASLGVPAGTVRRWKSTGGWERNGERSASVRAGKANVRAGEASVRPIDKQLASEINKAAELTDKERLFCLRYVKTFNATASAIAAGYSRESAGQAGWNLLQKEHIRSEVKRLKEIKADALLADASDVVEKYLQIAFADLSDFVEWGRYTVDVIGPFGPIEVDGKRLTQDVNDVRFKDSACVDAGIVTEVKLGKSGASIRLADRMKALQWLSDYFEMNPSDQHRREYDRRKMELELLRIQREAAPPEQDSPDDGFMDALNATAGGGWDPDTPDDSSADWDGEA